MGLLERESPQEEIQADESADLSTSIAEEPAVTINELVSGV